MYEFTVGDLDFEVDVSEIIPRAGLYSFEAKIVRAYTNNLSRVRESKYEGFMAMGKTEKEATEKLVARIKKAD